jgi:hypothetical protein
LLAFERLVNGLALFNFINKYLHQKRGVAAVGHAANNFYVSIVKNAERVGVCNA